MKEALEALKGFQDALKEVPNTTAVANDIFEYWDSKMDALIEAWPEDVYREKSPFQVLRERQIEEEMERDQARAGQSAVEACGEVLEQ
ncbi:uncharacterized protein KY384_001685 [Bacidia gigantensis]|uniref:uncharacterized protein n=1 Tax=Bacidia gigantensis TaxID=2732470 RepID=UPI001D05BD20|nr:uncharacterized protein KY384_001685 [Bacidia gigantensis]KAG8533944.1 hypothetical protein KY384_001685 [Bacidia gigantensis]